MAKKTSARSKGFRKYAPQKSNQMFTPSQWKKIGIGLAAIVLAIVLVIVLYDDGSLKVKDGSVVVDGVNPIVANINQKSNARYFKLGEAPDAIEGYSYTTTESAGDENVPLYYFEPDDPENADLTRYSVIGCRGNYAEVPVTSRENIALYLTDCEAGDVVTLTLAGREATSFTYTYARVDSDTEEVLGYTQAASAYVYAGRDDCNVLLSVFRYTDDREDVLSDELLTDYFEKIAETIQFEDAKE